VVSPPIFTRTPVLLDPLAHVFDPELAAQGHYEGASLRLQRSGAPSADDIFVARGLLGSLTEGGQLSYAGVDVGEVSTNAGGVLELNFDSDASHARVDGVLRSIGYAYAGDASTPSVELDWLFSDGNEGGDQGDGGAFTALGKTVVSIAPTNQPPVNTVPGPQKLDKDGTVEITGISVSDPDAATLQVTLRARHGKITLADTDGLTFASGDGHADRRMTFKGTIDDVNVALARLDYERGSGFERRDVIRIVTNDLGGSSAGQPLTDRDVIVVRRGGSRFDFGDDDSDYPGRAPHPADGASDAEAHSLATLHRQAVLADMELMTG
jgi:hypothetical protein